MKSLNCWFSSGARFEFAVVFLNLSSSVINFTHALLPLFSAYHFLLEFTECSTAFTWHLLRFKSMALARCKFGIKKVVFLWFGLLQPLDDCWTWPRVCLFQQLKASFPNLSLVLMGQEVYQVRILRSWVCFRICLRLQHHWSKDCLFHLGWAHRLFKQHRLIS